MGLLSRGKNSHEHEWEIKNGSREVQVEYEPAGLRVLRFAPQNRVCAECNRTERHGFTSVEEMTVPWSELGEWEEAGEWSHPAGMAPDR